MLYRGELSVAGAEGGTSGRVYGELGVLDRGELFEHVDYLSGGDEEAPRWAGRERGE